MSRQQGVRNEMESASDILYNLDRLEDMVGDGKRLPIGRKVMVDENEFMDLLAEIRANIPLEIRRAQAVVKERERIIGEAQDAAINIVNDARQQAQLLVSEHTVLAEAKQRGEEILKLAEKEGKEAKGRAELFILNNLRAAHDAMVSAMGDIEGTIESSLGKLQAAEQTLTGERPIDDY